MLEVFIDILVNILTTPNHYFAEVFLLNILGIVLEAEEIFFNLI